MDQAEISKIAGEVDRELKQADESAISHLEQDLADYVHSAMHKNSDMDPNKNPFASGLIKHLQDGKMPSAYFAEHITRFKGFLSKDLIPYFYKSIDSIGDWQTNYDSYYRRSYRSRSNLRRWYGRIGDILMQYRRLTDYHMDVCTLVTHEGADARLKIYMERTYSPFVGEYYIAAKLDEKDAKLEDVLEGIFYRDEGTMQTGLIRAVMMSHNEKMYEMMGKTLVAARLSEGLRQAICENMDFGTEEAFRYLLKVVIEKDLIRFSAIKRAFYTFTGLGGYDETDLERISNKQLALIDAALSDPKKIEEMLDTEDSMQIYLGLWAMALSDIDPALDRAEKLCLEGSRHQRLCASYFLANTNVPYADKNVLVNRLVKEHKDDYENLAILKRIFMGNCMGRVRMLLYPGRTSRYTEKDKYKKKVYADWKEYFASEAECLEYYALLKELLKELPKKGHEFTPSVFPWNTETLTRSDLIERIVFCASALKDQEKMADAATMIKEISIAGYGTRTNAMELLLREPETPELFDALVDSIADPESYTRDEAHKLLKQELESDRRYLPAEIASDVGQLPERCYDRLEGLLRMKKEDVRGSVMFFLRTRSAETRLEMLKRLLSDNKEEKRTAALDIILQMRETKDEQFEQAKELVALVKEPTSKESILIKEISGGFAEEKTEAKDFYDVNAEYTPVIDEAYLAECAEEWMKVFPESKVMEVLPGGNAPESKKGLGALAGVIKKKLTGTAEGGKTEKGDVELLQKLDDLIEANKDREFQDWNGPALLRNALGREYHDGKAGEMAFKELWDDFYEKNATPEQVIRLKLLYESWYHKSYYLMGFAEHMQPFVSHLLGGADLKYRNMNLRYPEQINKVLNYYYGNVDRNKIMKKMPAVFAYYLSHCKDSYVYEYKADKERREYVRRSMKDGEIYKESFLALGFVSFILEKISLDEKAFPIYYEFSEKVYKAIRGFDENRPYYYSSRINLAYIPQLGDYISAVVSGYISKDFMYKKILEKGLLSDTMDKMSSLICCVREADQAISTRFRYGNSVYQQRVALENLFKRKHEEIDLKELSETDKKKLELVEECYENITALTMDKELVRGDTQTEYSDALRAMKRVYGLDYFVRILMALGNDTLERSVYYYYHYSNGNRVITKKESLSHLLSICIPDPKEGEVQEQAKGLKERIKGTDLKESRLIEAALYSPEWLPVVGEYLGWDGFISGCYYFMAHMNERFDNKKAAMIAKYTPLTEEELNIGAFDIDWFKEVYEALGEKRFNEIYKAAKYISDGAKHTRARKYSDAASGKMDEAETEKQITDKRNKDLLMAYALIPCETEKLKQRYAFIQKYLKESKQFGAQRRASEKAASEMAVKNLAKASGYEDETRFILKMEREISSGLLGYFEAHEVGEYTLYLEADDTDKVGLVTEKGGKKLKALPAAIKKDEYVLEIQEAKKTFTEQYRRTKQMLEEAMENGTEYFVSEITDMSTDPVAGAIVNKLLFQAAEGDFLGFVAEMKEAGLAKDARIVVAHPFHLFRAGKWHDFQKLCFEKEIRQPFKQIFRELYVKTEEEMQTVRSMRYAGNQINPKITVGTLKSRRWIADAEEGLQKVYYKENLIATIYALADWFSPSDIEAPTLEWVAFYDRKTFKEKPISEIPDIIFSEVMRDVDLAVSVAHAGEIDPEMSHSTIEMRKAIAEFVVPMFKLKNVTFTDSHALIKGERGNYSVHLGSGVIHQEGGPMIHVLPVHSQHRGRIFLPFVDDDPKTAEVLSKIIFFAEDKKIKDPYILEQLV